MLPKRAEKRGGWTCDHTLFEILALLDLDYCARGPRCAGRRGATPAAPWQADGGDMPTPSGDSTATTRLGAQQKGHTTGRKYDLQMKRTELEQLGQYDCIVIVTDHSDYDYKQIVGQAKLVVDTRNATKGIDSPKVVRC